MTNRCFALFAIVSLALPGCVVTTTESHTWYDQGEQPAYERYGRVESVREVVQRQQGNPAGGAIAGAIIGGLIGSALGAHTHYDRWGYAYTVPSAPGAMVGAVGGAAVGAAASQGTSETRWYEVDVRFDDGGYETFTYRNSSPFRVGDEVLLGPRGLLPAR